MTPESGLGVEWNIRAKWKNAGNAFEDVLMAAVALGHITQCFHFNRKRLWFQPQMNTECFFQQLTPTYFVSLQQYKCLYVSISG